MYFKLLAEKIFQKNLLILNIVYSEINFIRFRPLYNTLYTAISLLRPVSSLSVCLKKIKTTLIVILGWLFHHLCETRCYDQLFHACPTLTFFDITPFSIKSSLNASFIGLKNGISSLSIRNCLDQSYSFGVRCILGSGRPNNQPFPHGGSKRPTLYTPGSALTCEKLPEAVSRGLCHLNDFYTHALPCSLIFPSHLSSTTILNSPVFFLA